MPPAAHSAMWAAAQARAQAFSYASFEKRSVSAVNLGPVFRGIDWISSQPTYLTRIQKIKDNYPTYCASPPSPPVARFIRFARVVQRGLLSHGFRFFIASSLPLLRVCARSDLAAAEADDIAGPVNSNGHGGGVRDGGGRGAAAGGWQSGRYRWKPQLQQEPAGSGRFAAVIVKGRNHYALE